MPTKSNDQPTDAVTSAPESGDPRVTGVQTPPPADPKPTKNPPGEPTVGEDWESGRQQAKP